MELSTNNRLKILKRHPNIHNNSANIGNILITCADLGVNLELSEIDNTYIVTRNVVNEIIDNSNFSIEILKTLNTNGLFFCRDQFGEYLCIYQS